MLDGASICVQSDLDFEHLQDDGQSSQNIVPDDLDGHGIFAHTNEVCCDITQPTVSDVDSDEDSDDDFYSDMLSSSEFTVYDLSVLIQVFGSRHNLSSVTISGMLAFHKSVHELALPTNAKQLRNYLLLEQIKTTQYVYCLECNSTISGDHCNNDKCKNCINNKGIFMEVSVVDQLRLKFSEPEFVKDLTCQSNVVPSMTGAIKDQCCGHCFV